MRHAGVSAGKITPVVLGARGGGAVGPKEEVLRSLSQRARGFESQVPLVAWGDPRDDRHLAAAGGTKDRGLETHELKAFPRGTRAVHKLQAHPVLDPDEIGAAAAEVEPIKRERPAAPRGVLFFHAHAEAGPAEIRMIGDERG